MEMTLDLGTGGGVHRQVCVGEAEAEEGEVEEGVEGGASGPSEVRTRGWEEVGV